MFAGANVLRVIISGQELDLRRFAGASPENIVALKDDAELDDYTYRVAGCVGEFWTKMCRAHLFPGAAMDEAMLLANGVRFGKGLQLVNILRDLPVMDLRNGRCYLPALRNWNRGGTGCRRFAGTGQRAEVPPVLCALSGPGGRAFDRRLGLHQCIAGALHPRAAGLRTWPILIGMRTLAMLRAGNVLDPGHRIKVSRPEVNRLILRSVLYYPWPGAWRRLVSPPGSGA